ncbi:MAG: adenine deaminase [Chitinophagaceae bacterium]|nr:adenine deaminase [Chitinophagaceae bacterium]
MKETILGNIVDVHGKRIFFGELCITNGTIYSLEERGGEDKSFPYLLPGFIDAHVHVESSMLVPSEFARLAVVHGTVGTISDPHEIANVCGMPGVDYMIENGKSVPFKFHFGAPSCVPATTFETAGAELDVTQVDELLGRKEIYYLSEMMNFPGVLHGDETVMQKIAAAKKYGKPVDGHAPGLMGEDAVRYINAGISTDHECFTLEEALHKLKHGMKILIREGSAARNFEALIPLLHDYEDEIMFCSDDKHPDSLAEGHINDLCSRAVEKGINVFKVLKAACINPVEHYKMNVGRLRPGDQADLVVCEDLTHFRVMATYIDGIKVAENGISLIHPQKAEVINQFEAAPLKADSFHLKWSGEKMRVIHALDGQLITESTEEEPKVEKGMVVGDPERDILKIVVVNRYEKNVPPAIALIRNFGLKKGAIASSVAHDSHNVIAVGVDDESICEAVNLIIREKGGVSLAVYGQPEATTVLALPVAGLMSNENGYEVAREYTAIDRTAKALGCQLGAPYMTLSFMALLVIPKLKLSDKGLFDGERFCFV